MVSGLGDGISQPSELSRNQRLSITPTAEKDTAIERVFGKNEVTDFFGDMYRAWKTGAGQAGTVDDALKVFASGTNVTDETLQDYIQAVQTMESFSPSEEMQDFSRIYEAEGKGVKGFIKGVLKNPTAAVQVAVSSLRSMINPASVAAGTAGAGAGAAAGLAGGILAPITSTAGAGIGSILGMTGALETALSYTEFLKEELQKKGLAFDDEGIRAVLEDEQSRNTIRNRSLGRGATISALNAITGGLAGGVAAKVGTKLGRTAGALSGLGTQAVGGGAAEAAGRAVAGQEMDVAEIGFEALGEIAGPSIIGTAIGVAKTPEYKINNEVVSRADIENIINSNDYDGIAGITYEIVNDPVLKEKVNQARQDAPIAKAIKETFDKDKQPSKEQLKQLIELEKEITKLKDNKTPRAKVKLKELEEQYKTISDAIQKPSTEEIPLSKQPETSPAVGTGDTKGAVPAGEIASEETQTTQPAEEVETQIEDDASEVVEETYTLPENPREAKKDFEIIDNRDGFLQELEEGGDNKWIVRNIKTGSIGPSSTKSQAQQLINNTTNRQGIRMDYGEGQPVLEEFKTQVEEEVVVAPIEVSPTDKTQKIGDFEVILTKDNVIKSIKKKGQEVSTQGRQKAESLLVEQGFIKVIPDEVTNIEGLNPIDAANKTLDESNNPQEIAFAIRAVDNIKTEQASQLKEALQSGLPSMFTLKQKFTPTSIIEVIGNKPSELGKNFTRTWVSKDGKSLEDGFIDENKIQFTKEQVAEFITNFPNKTEYNNSIKKSTVDLKRDLENKLKEITGINPSAENIQLISEITEEGIREAESKAVFEAEKLSQQKPIVPPEQRKTPKADKPEPRPDITDGLKTLDESFANITEEAVKTNLDNFASQVKSNLTRRGVLTEQARGTSTMRIDQAFGLNNSTKIYRTVIRPIIDVYTKFKTDYRRVNTDAEKAEDFIRYEGKSKTDKLLGRGRKQNDVTKDLYEIRLYQLAREYVSNIVDGVPSEKSPNPVELAQFTADEALAGRVLTDADGKALIELLKKHVKNGEINPDVMKRKLKPSQKKALKILDKRNAELEQKIIKNAQRSDKELDLINNYSHRVVLKSPLKQNVDVENEAKDFSENFEGVTEKERTEGVKPISLSLIHI